MRAIPQGEFGTCRMALGISWWRYCYRSWCCRRAGRWECRVGYWWGTCSGWENRCCLWVMFLSWLYDCGWWFRWFYQHRLWSPDPADNHIFSCPELRHTYFQLTINPLQLYDAATIEIRHFPTFGTHVHLHDRIAYIGIGGLGGAEVNGSAIYTGVMHTHQHQHLLMLLPAHHAGQDLFIRHFIWILYCLIYYIPSTTTQRQGGRGGAGELLDGE